MSYTFGEFTNPRAVVRPRRPDDPAIKQSSPATSSGAELGRQPPRRAATIHDRSRREEKVRGVVVTSPVKEMPNTVGGGATGDFYLSDASGIAVLRQNSANRHPAQSEKSGLSCLPENVSHSANNLLAHAGTGADSSDEGSGGETVGECFICYNVFDEDLDKMTPRNLQCGHAFCTGE